jgi:predicted metalloprotease with PDZ domain
MRLTVLPQVTLGPQTRSDVPVTRLPAAALKKSFGDALHGLAGTGFIDGARWRLDLARDRLCVEPGRFATPGGFGLTLERQGTALQIGLVLPGSPAERAGLRAGEIVTQWPGGTTTEPLTALWSAVRGVDEIVVGIGEPARQVTLRRAIFAPAAAP